MEYQLSIREHIMSQLKTLAVRLPEKAIREIKAIAESQYMPTRTLIRAWIMQRLEAEQSNIEPVPGAEVGATTPGTDGHQTQGAGADGY
jgi:hypothetical protein